MSMMGWKRVKRLTPLQPILWGSIITHPNATNTYGPRCLGSYTIIQIVFSSPRVASKKNVGQTLFDTFGSLKKLLLTMFGDVSIGCVCKQRSMDSSIHIVAGLECTAVLCIQRPSWGIHGNYQNNECCAAACTQCAPVRNKWVLRSWIAFKFRTEGGVHTYGQLILLYGLKTARAQFASTQQNTVRCLEQRQFDVCSSPLLLGTHIDSMLFTWEKHEIFGVWRAVDYCASFLLMLFLISGPNSYESYAPYIWAAPLRAKFVRCDPKW